MPIATHRRRTVIVAIRLKENEVTIVVGLGIVFGDQATARCLICTSHVESVESVGRFGLAALDQLAGRQPS